MSNKIFKTTVVIVIVLVIAGFIIRKSFGSANSLNYKIFESEARGYYFHKLLGIVPASYQDRYTNKKLLSHGLLGGARVNTPIISNLSNIIDFLDF